MSESDVPERIEAPLADLMPPEWRQNWVWISCYRVYLATLDQLQHTSAFDLLGVRGHLLWGGAPYFAATHRLRAERDGSVVVEMNVDGVRRAEDGHFLLLMTPHGQQPVDDAAARVRAVVALVRLALGSNAAADHLGDLSINPSTDEVRSAGPALAMPTWDGPPDLSDDGLGFLDHVHIAVGRLDDEQETVSNSRFNGCSRRVLLTVSTAF